ncbi:MAG: hypothetical protein JO013_11295 [Alphaproteobacteria bacterium]|nr:hypothetical protein [Alphaproteobacteria bacterium]
MTDSLLRTALAAVSVTLIVMARQLGPHLQQRRFARAAKPPARPGPSWSPRPRFDPIDAGPARGRGYTGYTESFAATGTVYAYMDALPDEEARILTVAFACAYLQTRMGARLSPQLTADGGEGEGGGALDASSALGWLAAIHANYADNAPPDSTFVRLALERAVEDYARGRSLRAQRAWRDLATKLLVDGLEVNERSARLDEERKRTDLDPAAVRPLLLAAARAGRDLGASHNMDGARSE